MDGLLKGIIEMPGLIFIPFIERWRKEKIKLISQNIHPPSFWILCPGRISDLSTSLSLSF